MTPPELLAQLTALFPAFAAVWADPGNCFREDDGSFTALGLFSEFYAWFHGRETREPAERLAAPGAFVSACVAAGGDVADAAALGFLEATTFAPAFARRLTGEALR